MSPRRPISINISRSPSGTFLIAANVISEDKRGVFEKGECFAGFWERDAQTLEPMIRAAVPRLARLYGRQSSWLQKTADDPH